METTKQINHAILDIGSNSFHFVVYKIDSDKSFSVLLRKRIIWRLALQKKGGRSFLSEEDFVQTEKIIFELLEIANSFSCAITATATSAVREATNAIQFIDRIVDTTGIGIEILSGEREAFLIYKAILFSHPDALFQNILCIDIGGGSTEFILGSKGKIILVESLKLGAVRLTAQFFPSGFLENNKIEECRVLIKNELQCVKQKLSLLKIDFITGNSGTIHAANAIVVANHLCVKDEQQTESVLTRKGLDEVTELLLNNKTVDERKTIAGIELDRADILPAGALILQMIFHELNFSEIELSDYSMREGKLLEVVEGSESPL